MMEAEGPLPWPSRPREGPRTPAVRVFVQHRRLELMFDRGFTAADVAAVKAIPGRRWIPERLIWTLPNTPAALEALSRALGPRLVVIPPAEVGAAAAEVGPAAAEIGPAAAERANRERALPGTRPEEIETLLETVRRTIRTRGYSRKTEAAYARWVRRFVRFNASAVDRIEHLDASHARAFLEHLATDEGLAARSRNQAAAALGFTFREIFGRDELADIPRAKGPKRVPAVLTHREVLRVLRALTGKYFLIVVLLYSAGLRLEECLRLRVKDIDFELRQILVRDGKGRKDRYVPLARRAVDLLRAQIERVAELHTNDRAANNGWAPLPGALHRKDPTAGYELGWQYVFPATTLHDDPATGRSGRRPLHPTAVQREVKAAVRRSGIPKRATCHTFRHSFATEALRGGCDIRTLQHVMGHKDIRTTTIYLHVVEQTGLYIRSPLDRPDDPDDYDPDPVGRPWRGPEDHWGLAAKQWDPAAKRDRRPAGPTPDDPPAREPRPSRPKNG
jgi:integron integrase